MNKPIASYVRPLLFSAHLVFVPSDNNSPFHVEIVTGILSSIQKFATRQPALDAFKFAVTKDLQSL